MMLLFGLGTIAVGVAYIGLGILSAVEVLQFRRTRGVSRFGVGFSLMAASCGPHHLVHGWHFLHGMDQGGLLAVTTVVGLPAGLVFVILRVEALLGGRGDRFVSGTPWWVTLSPLVFLVTVGLLVDRATAAPTTHSFDPTSAVFLTNAFVTVTYSLVGWCLLRTQVRRRITDGGWSLSGLSLSAVFPTCALMHGIYALTATGDMNTLALDILGVPASVYFLWVVYGLHSESIVDWNRRPIVGDPSRPSRPSPWQPQPV